MILEKLSWKSASGIGLVGNLWKPESNTKAIVVFIHGFGEHCLRYTPYFELFENEGIVFISYDQMGHGASKGKRGAISSYKHLLDDIQICLNKAKELFPELPLFVYGHSMGGNIVSNFLIYRKPEIAGSVITSPWLKLTKEKGFLFETIGSLLSVIIPNVTVPSDLHSSHISSINTEVEKYEKDPLNHGRISFRLFDQITKKGKLAIENSKEINVPTILFHGTDDMITSPLASAKFAKANTDYIKFKEWPKGFHELHNDFCRDDVVGEIIEWIKTKV